MKIITIALGVAALAFLGKVGSIIYEVSGMSFDFNRPWPEDETQAVQAEKQILNNSFHAQWKTEIEELRPIPIC